MMLGTIAREDGRQRPDAKNAVLQFSGGKDSTALLYLARPWLDRITVLFAETGATFPHLVKHINDTCEKLNANLVVVKPPVILGKDGRERPYDVFEHTRIYGLPADIVPVEASAVMAQFLNPPPAQLLQPYTHCCGAMLWEPMLRYVRENGVDLVLRGSKACDRRVGVGPSAEVDGVTYESPLWDWSDEDVYAYLREQGAELPQHYESINDSLDCWLCTAHLAHHGDEKMKYIRASYPDLWPVVSERMARVKSVLSDEMARINSALDFSALDLG
jgi:3'-phosphoadenosine 5'-phosphosulfate sulfotransferase (PAPS reductase)/FAD synthetase